MRMLVLMLVLACLGGCAVRLCDGRLMRINAVSPPGNAVLPQKGATQPQKGSHIP